MLIKRLNWEAYGIYRKMLGDWITNYDQLDDESDENMSSSEEDRDGGELLFPNSLSGVTFDRNLKFRAHMEQVVKKGTKFTLALAGISGNQ